MVNKFRDMERRNQTYFVLHQQRQKKKKNYGCIGFFLPFLFYFSILKSYNVVWKFESWIVLFLFLLFMVSQNHGSPKDFCTVL